MALKDAKEIGDLAIAVVDDLGRRATSTSEEDASHADKGFRVGPVWHGRYAGDQALGQPALAADVAGRRADGING